MVEVKLNKSNENPFYGMKACLNLLRSVGQTITPQMLDKAWAEVKGNKEKKEMFYSLLFSIGDITARQHNIFKNVKRDSGGNANREGFHTVLTWIWNNDKEQFAKFLVAGLFNEYSCFDILLRNRVQTKGSKVINVYDTLNNDLYRQYIVSYLYSVLKGSNRFNKILVAKFLSLPRLSKRQGHKKMLPETKKVMEGKVKLLKELSDLMGWEYEITPTVVNFKGYRAWRKEYNKDLESVIFSTGAIADMDRDSFLKWFDTLPAQARFRVKNRILYSKKKVLYTDESLSKDLEQEIPKYPLLQQWYNEWEQYKTKKQQEQRILEEKVRQEQATTEDKARLEKVKKQAKVTVGATNFNDIYEQICTGRIDVLKLESFINKVNLPYNSLVIIDDSGSMSGKPFNFAAFIAAVCLCKNPDDDGRNLLGFFNNSSHWHSFIDSTAKETPNSILRRNESVKIRPSAFVDPEKSFIKNYRNIAGFCRSVFQGGGTNISAIPDGLHHVCKRHPEILDALKAYSVWTIISDGEWNNLHSPEASMNDFMRKCENYFGFKPFVVAIDAAKGWGWDDSKIERFSGIDNMMYIPANPAQIEQFLTNFKDMDVFDAYTPLQSIHRSNRYDLVRANIL